MRIQPHVWASCSPADPATYLAAVVRNSICTHSHPTGILGAVFHALCVGYAMRVGQVPSPFELRAIVEATACVPDVVASDRELGFWRVAFEQEVGRFDEAWERAVEELRQAMRVARKCGTPGEDGYAAVVDSLKLREPARRGSGMLTALAAVGLAWCEPRPAEAMRIAANALRTDTDTIATMAGALLGAGADVDPPVEVLDADLFRSEARRLSFGQTLLIKSRAVLQEAPSHPVPGERPKQDTPQTDVSRSLPEEASNDSSGAQGRRSDAGAPRTQNEPVATHDVGEVVSFMQGHIDDDRVVGKTLRRVVRKGTTADIAAFTAALVTMLGRGTAVSRERDTDAMRSPSR